MTGTELLFGLEWLAPGLILILGGILIAVVPEKFRSTIVLLFPILTLFQIWNLPKEGFEYLVGLSVAGFQIFPVYVHPFSHIFSTVFALAAFSGGLFALNQSNRLELSSAFIYGGSAIGVVFSGDLITLFIFWEIMALGSTLVIWSEPTESAHKAGFRYAIMHLVGGVILMAGITGYVSTSGSFLITQFDVDVSTLASMDWTSVKDVSILLMLVGILMNTAAPPLSSWLPDAYPETSPFGAVFLSAFTTKTAVFVLLTLFPGSDVLIYVGLFMVFYGIIWAILENDMRRILAYSIINQVGFMVTGIGIGTEMSLLGAAAHAFCHIIYKALLLMSAGGVLYMTGERKCSRLGGLYRTMPITMVCGTIGALAISSFPWTSGFISKSLISDAAAHEHLAFVWFLLVAASAGVFLHAGIKFPWFVFFQKDSGMRPKDPPMNMRIAMILLAALCIIPGLFPDLVYALLPTQPNYEPYTLTHVVTQLQLLLFAGLAFFVLLPLLKRTETISLDFDWFYRFLMKRVLLLTNKLFELLNRYLNQGTREVATSISFTLRNFYGELGVLSRGVTIGSSVMIAVVLLGVYLLIYYLAK